MAQKGNSYKITWRKVCNGQSAFSVLSCLLFLPNKSTTFNWHQLLHFRYENRTGRVSYRLGKRLRYIRSRPQFLIKRRWCHARRYRGKVRVRVGRRYWRVKVKRGRAAYGGKNRWRGIRRPRVRRGAVMRVRCGGKLRKIYKRGRRLVMNRKGRLRTLRWGCLCCMWDCLVPKT